MNMFFKKLFSLKSTSSLIYIPFFPPVFNVANSVMKILAHASFLICLFGTFGYIPGSVTVDSKVCMLNILKQVAKAHLRVAPYLIPRQHQPL